MIILTKKVCGKNLPNLCSRVDSCFFYSFVVALTLLAMCLRFGKVLFSDDACSQLLHLIFKKLFSAQRSASARSIRQVPVLQSSFGIRLHPANSIVFDNFGCFDWYEKWLESLKKICVRGQVVWKSRCYKACFDGLQKDPKPIFLHQISLQGICNFEELKLSADILEIVVAQLQVFSWKSLT